MSRFARYTTIGLVATAAHYAVLVLCVQWLHWPAYLCSGLGAVVGAQVAFFGNRSYTFGHTGRLRDAWPRFQATAAASALLGMAVVAAGGRLGIHYLVAQVIATGLGLLLSYVVNRFWTFR